MSNQETERRRWRSEKMITDVLIEQALVDPVQYIMSKMRAEFEEAKHLNGWPDNAAIIWRISWEYEPPEEQS